MGQPNENDDPTPSADPTRGRGLNAVIYDETADLTALVEQSPDGVVVVRGGVVIYVNASFARFLGRERDEVLGEMFLDLLFEAYQEPMTKLLVAEQELGQSRPSEYGFVGRDGVRVTLQLTPMWLDAFGGRPSPAFIARDVSRVKQTQADLLLADRMMTVGALAAGVAHEINNPMSYVIGNLHYCLSVLSQDGIPRHELGELRTAMREALDGAERVSGIVKNFHTFSKADSTSTSALSLSKLVESALTASFVQIRRKARLVRDLRPTPPVVGSEGRLGQVVLNLILNAVQALPDHQSPSNTIDVATYEEDGLAVFRIRDSGPGIPPQVLNHVFEPFFTTKPVGVGTGLGLSIAHSIVRQQGGTIDVESTLGQGTTFTVRLPPQRPPKDEEPLGAEPKFVPARTGRILVIDDEPLIVNAFKRVLRNLELEVAYSGREAIEILADDVNFDLIFCDLYMPVVTGMDVYDWIRKTNPGLEETIVFMTGGAHDALSQSFLDRVPNRRLNKPFNPDDIQRMVSAG